MKRWYQLDNETKTRGYNQISDATGIMPYAVEKDWWVVQTLSLLFEMDMRNFLVFKGGTSLSKAWNLIERFSEDIDIAIDRSFFGFDGKLSKKQRTNLRKETSKYITEIVYPGLLERFHANGLSEVTLNIEEPKTSDQDPRVIEIYYPNVIPSPGYLQPKVQVEIGGRSLREPYSIRTFSSLVDEYYSSAEFAQAPIDIPSVNPERTLLEKIFLLHEEFQRPAGKIRVNRLSRHLYDIYQLSKTEYAKKIFINKSLYEEIVVHRHFFTRLGGVDYNLHNPQSINPLPPPELFDAWKTDYKTMQTNMIYGNSPDFDEMIDDIRKFISHLNNVSWKMDAVF